MNEAAFVGDAAGVRRALAAGANIETKSDAYDPASATPLHLAALGLHGDAIEVLLANGADPTVADDAGRVARELA